MKEYFVYILRCSDGSYYTGVTNNYQLRVAQHQEGHDTSCYTYKRRPVELVYLAEFQEVAEAIHWEKVLKGWSRKKKEALISGNQKALEMAARSSYRIFIDRIRLSIHTRVTLSSTKGDIYQGHGSSGSP